MPVHPHAKFLQAVTEIIAPDIEKNKVRSDIGITYDKDVLRLIDMFGGLGLYVGSVVVNGSIIFTSLRSAVAAS